MQKEKEKIEDVHSSQVIHKMFCKQSLLDKSDVYLLALGVNKLRSNDYSMATSSMAGLNLAVWIRRTRVFVRVATTWSTTVEFDTTASASDTIALASTTWTCRRQTWRAWRDTARWWQWRHVWRDIWVVVWRIFFGIVVGAFLDCGSVESRCELFDSRMLVRGFGEMTCLIWLDGFRRDDLRRWERAAFGDVGWHTTRMLLPRWDSGRSARRGFPSWDVEDI